MRDRLSRFGVLLLVGAIVLGGLTGCERRAESRESGEDVTGAEATDATAGDIQVSPTVEGVIVPAATSAMELVATVAAGTEDTIPAPEAAEEADVMPTPVPAAAEEQQAPTTGKNVKHTVQRGETLQQIAIKYGTTVSAIVKLNGLQNKNQIIVGQKLTIPASGSTSGGSTGGTSGCSHNHKVRSGEWVWQIARDYGVSPYDILAANGLTIQSGQNIQPGKVLCIP